jgi:hypothetical protein
MLATVRAPLLIRLVAPTFLAGVACSVLGRSFAAHQREPLWMLDRFQRQIDVKVRPIQMVWVWKFHVQQVPDRNVLKPWKLLERQKKLVTSN